MIHHSLSIAGNSCFDRTPNVMPSSTQFYEFNMHVITLLRNSLYIFKKRYVLKVSLSHEIQPDYPMQFDTHFDYQIPLEVSRIDAAYERNTDHAILLFYGINNFYYTYFCVLIKMHLFLNRKTVLCL